MFMIQMKKELHKPFEAPYFVSPEYKVASWFYYHAPVTVDPVSISLVKVSKHFDVETVDADEQFKNQDVSPDFHVAPLFVYGARSAFSLPDGTSYYDWFEPGRWALSVLSEKEISDAGWNAVAKVPMNVWHPHHLFKKRENLVN